MATKKPKVSGYVPAPLKEALQSLCKQMEISESMGLSVVLAEHFGMNDVLEDLTPTTSIKSLSLSRLESIEAMVYELKDQVVSMQDRSGVNASPTRLSPVPETSSLGIDVSPDLSGGLSQRRLAVRLGCNHKTIQSRGKTPDKFQEWSRQKDPDGLAWYREGKGQRTKYYPVNH